MRRVETSESGEGESDNAEQIEENWKKFMAMV
jgi:hypothetical protein